MPRPTLPGRPNKAPSTSTTTGKCLRWRAPLDAHVTVAGNVYMALRNHLRGSPCSVFISDMKLRVEEDNAFFYPDVFVTCAESDRGQSHSKTCPVLVVEVLSPATSAYDRGAKFAAYRKLPDTGANTP